eukprot:13061506-Alexandrium_andersonii.AAC.1
MEGGAACLASSAGAACTWAGIGARTARVASVSCLITSTTSFMVGSAAAAPVLAPAWPGCPAGGGGAGLSGCNPA